jgi:hypothetical protein
MVLRDIEEKAGQFGPYWSWKFELVSDDLQEHHSHFVWNISNNNVHPAQGTADGSPRLRAAALMGRPIKDNEFLEGGDYEELINRRCRGAIAIEPDKKGTPRNVIKAFYPSKLPQDGAPAAAPAASNGRVPHPATYSGRMTPQQALDEAERERQLSYDDPFDDSLRDPTEEEIRQMAVRRSKAIEALKTKKWYSQDMLNVQGGYREQMHGRPVSRFANLTPARQLYEVESLEAAAASSEAPPWADIPF